MTTDPQHSTNDQHAFPRAADDSSYNPTVQQQRIANLLCESAAALQALARKSSTRNLEEKEAA